MRAIMFLLIALTTLATNSCIYVNAARPAMIVQEISNITEVPPPKCFTLPNSASSYLDSPQADLGSCVPLSPNNLNSTLAPVESYLSITCGKDTTIPPEKLGSCPDAQATLNAHNAARQAWGAPPLLWSKTLADYAQTVSNTCVFQHSHGPYGENLAIGTGLTCKGSVDLWYNEASAWTPGSGFSSATGHFTQLVWKSTLQVGCAVTNCGGSGNFVTCSYNPPGNVIGSFDSNVGAQGSTPECVAPTPGTPAGPSLPTPPIMTTSPPPPPPSLVSPPQGSSPSQSPPPNAGGGNGNNGSPPAPPFSFGPIPIDIPPQPVQTTWCCYYYIFCYKC